MKKLRILAGCALAGVGSLAAQTAGAQISLVQGKGSESLSIPMQTVVLLTLLTVLPAVIMSVTPFLRITVVLHFLRQALGTQATPSNQVLIGLALFLTVLIMQPVAIDMYHQGWEPMENGKATWQQAFDNGTEAAEGVLGPVRARKRREAVSGGLAHAAARSGRPISV